MSPTILAIRAVTSLYVRQILHFILIVGLAVYAIVMAIVIWLSSAVSPWWSLLGIIPTLLVLIGGLIWVIVWVLSGRLSPAMNKKQKAAAKKVVKDVSQAAEQLGTPRFILLFQVVKDVVFPPKNNRTLIGELADTPGKLKRDFENLRKLF